MMAKKTAKSPVKSKTTFTVQKVGAPGTIRHPLVHEATIGNRKRWSAWQDWVSATLGIYFALAPLWIPGAPFGLFMTLGILVFAASIWAGSTASSTLAEFVKTILGAIVIVSGLFGAHIEERTAILTSWWVGAALIVLSLVASYRNRSGRSPTNPHDNHQT